MRKIQLNAEKRDILYRSLIAFAMLFGTALLQTSFLPWLDLFGAIPDIVLIFVVGVGFFDGMKIGSPFGIGAGLLCYFLGGGGAAVFILFYSLCGLVSSMGFLGRNYPSWCLYMAASCLFKAVWSLLMCLLFSSVARPLAALWHSILPELLGTALLSLVMYRPVKAAARLLKRKSEL